MISAPFVRADWNYPNSPAKLIEINNDPAAPLSFLLSALSFADSPVQSVELPGIPSLFWKADTIIAKFSYSRIVASSSSFKAFDNLVDFKVGLDLDNYIRDFADAQQQIGSFIQPARHLRRLGIGIHSLDGCSSVMSVALASISNIDPWSTESGSEGWLCDMSGVLNRLALPCLEELELECLILTQECFDMFFCRHKHSLRRLVMKRTWLRDLDLSGVSPPWEGSMRRLAPSMALEHCRFDYIFDKKIISAMWEGNI